MCTKISCTHQDTYFKEEGQVCDGPRSCHYPEWTLKRARSREFHISHPELLKDKPCRTYKSDPPVTFSTMFSLQYKQIVGIIKKHLPLLSAESSMQKIMDKGVSFISRRAPTIGGKDLSSLFFKESTNKDTWLSAKVYYRCGHQLCTACGYSRLTHMFQSCCTGESCKIKLFINCNTKCVVYLVSCVLCNIQYVGCTTSPLKIRIRRHLSDATKTFAMGISMVSKHCQPAHNGDTSTLVFSGIEKVTKPLRSGDLRKKLFNRESYSIYNLGTRVLQGLHF